MTGFISRSYGDGPVGRAPHTRVCGSRGVGDKSCECHGGEDVKWPFAALWEFDLNSMVYRMSAEAVRVIKGGLTSPANERARPMWTGLIMFSAALARLVDVLERRDREALRERDAGRVVRAVAVRDLRCVSL